MKLLLATSLLATATMLALAPGGARADDTVVVDFFTGNDCDGSEFQFTVTLTGEGGGNVFGPIPSSDGIFSTARLVSFTDPGQPVGVCGRGFSCQQAVAQFDETTECVALSVDGNLVNIDKVCIGTSC